MVYKYGMKHRGVSPGAQPSSFIAFDDVDKLETGYWSFVYYDRKLTDEEISKYELTFITEQVWMGDA